MNGVQASRQSGVQGRDPAVGAVIIAAIRYLRVRSRQVALEFAQVRGVPQPEDAPPYPSEAADLQQTSAAADRAWSELEALLALPCDPCRPEPGPVASRVFSDQAPTSEHPKYGEQAMADADQPRVQLRLERASATPDLDRIAHLQGLHDFYRSVGEPDYWDQWLARQRHPNSGP